MNPTLFRHLMLATERGPDGAGGEGSGPDFNCWSTPATGGLASGSLALHPAPKSGVGVEWISPLSGRIQLTGMVQDLQGIEDGVSWATRLPLGSGGIDGRLGDRSRRRPSDVQRSTGPRRPDRHDR